MYSINVQKLQNTPRNSQGIAAIGEKRIRTGQPDIPYTTPNGLKRVKLLHPTKGYRDMALRRLWGRR